MKKNTKRSRNPEASYCLCRGVGPALSECLRRLGPPGESRRHFENARLEFLKGLRALLDARIAQCSNPKTKGEKIDVE